MLIKAEIFIKLHIEFSQGVLQSYKLSQQYLRINVVFLQQTSAASDKEQERIFMLIKVEIFINLHIELSQGAILSYKLSQQYLRINVVFVGMNMKPLIVSK